MSQLRAVAASCVHQVVEHGQSLNKALPLALAKVPSNEQALLQEICYGTLRWYPQISLYLTKLLKRPIKSKDKVLLALLATGIYQISHMRIANHAALSETVSATKPLKRDWAKAFINGILREYLRNAPSLENKLRGNPSFSFAHPQWLIDRFKQEWPSYWRHILKYGNQTAPMCLRVNQQHISRDDYMTLLKDAGHSASPCRWAPHGIYISQATDIEKLPKFDEGYASVQDEAAQLVCYALDLKSQQHFLDACCAPGGKLCHALEITPDLVATGLDAEAERQVRTKENLHRLGLHAQLKVGRADNKATWWDGTQFDRILVDAPCSGTGVIRRHPDIKLLRTPEDINKLTELQLEILCHLWPTLKPGGILVYSTCSVIASENTLVVQQFLNKYTDAQIETCDLDMPPWGANLEQKEQTHQHSEPSTNVKTPEEQDCLETVSESICQTPFGTQLFPTGNSHDGFFFARIRKVIL